MAAPGLAWRQHHRKAWSGDFFWSANTDLVLAKTRRRAPWQRRAEVKRSMERYKTLAAAAYVKSYGVRPALHPSQGRWARKM